MKAEDTIEKVLGFRMPKINGFVITRSDAEAIYKAGQEEEARGGTNAISYLRGIEAERKKWIKEAIKAGILISNPKELAEIIEALDDARWAGYYSGINEVVEFVIANRIIPLCDYRVTGTIRQDEEHREDCRRCAWQAKLKEWGIE